MVNCFTLIGRWMAGLNEISLDDLINAENPDLKYPKFLVRISCSSPFPKIEKIYNTRQGSYAVEYYLKQTITLPEGDSGWPKNIYIYENTAGPYLMVNTKILKTYKSVSNKLYPNKEINKAITMMRGKSPRSDVEMTKKNQLNFVAAILDF